MIITRIAGGTGNQLFQYAAGRRLALKWNTELKIDKSLYDSGNRFMPYTLDQFNIKATVATADEIESLKKICAVTKLGIEEYSSVQEVLDYPDNVYLYGDWCNDIYFWDIRDFLLKELTLKNPISSITATWKEKILATDCAVSMHFRHGDFLYNPACGKKAHFHVPPLDYYYNCIKALMQLYKNITVFVFSNNLQWCKENLRLNVPIEFVEGWQDDERFNGAFVRDIEEMYLMSICKHSINPRSAFSWWGAYLNQNPDKKIFVSRSANEKEALYYEYFFTPRRKNSPLESDKWMYIPFAPNKQPEVTMRPFFSVLLVVNNDAATLPETLGTILNQKYKYFELIIIDNASFDDSGKICQQAAKTHDNVTLIKLYDKISNGAAWNRAVDAAQGDSLIFVKGNDKFLNNALSFLYTTNERPVADIVSSVTWLREDDSGTVNLADRKFVVEKDLPFRDLKGNVQPNFDKMTLLRILSSNATLVPLATRAFKRKFLLDNAIRFDEQVSDNDAELLFTVETMLRTGKIIFTPQPIYAAPKADTLRGGVLT